MRKRQGAGSTKGAWKRGCRRGGEQRAQRERETPEPIPFRGAALVPFLTLSTSILFRPFPPLPPLPFPLSLLASPPPRALPPLPPPSPFSPFSPPDRARRRGARGSRVSARSRASARSHPRAPSQPPATSERDSPPSAATRDPRAHPPAAPAPPLDRAGAPLKRRGAARARAAIALGRPSASTRPLARFPADRRRSRARRRTKEAATAPSPQLRPRPSACGSGLLPSPPFPGSPRGGPRTRGGAAPVA